MQIRWLAAIFAVASLCAGCASVVDGATQPIFVATTPVAGANCTCSNDRGSWSVVTPGSVVIKKSESVLQILCSKPGYRDGKTYAAGHMTTAGTVGMMLPYVGLINSAVDASTGAALTYPDSYSIELKPAAPTPGS
jgi:hypothetical protein